MVFDTFSSLSFFFLKLLEQQRQFAEDQQRLHSDVSERVEEILGKTQSASLNLEAMMNVQSKRFSEGNRTFELLLSLRSLHVSLSLGSIGVLLRLFSCLSSVFPLSVSCGSI